MQTKLRLFLDRSCDCMHIPLMLFPAAPSIREEMPVSWNEKTLTRIIRVDCVLQLYKLHESLSAAVVRPEKADSTVEIRERLSTSLDAKGALRAGNARRFICVRCDVCKLMPSALAAACLSIPKLTQASDMLNSVTQLLSGVLLASVLCARPYKLVKTPWRVPQLTTSLQRVVSLSQSCALLGFALFLSVALSYRYLQGVCGVRSKMVTFVVLTGQQSHFSIALWTPSSLLPLVCACCATLAAKPASTCRNRSTSRHLFASTGRLTTSFTVLAEGCQVKGHPVLGIDLVRVRGSAVSSSQPVQFRLDLGCCDS